MNDSLFIVIPAYNEEDNILNTINEWYPVIENHPGHGRSRLVIINDGSKDRTLDIIKTCAQAMPLLVPLSKPNGGHGSTVLFGYRYGIEQGADYIFQTDSDGQTDPKEFEKFWADRNEFDAIIGKRIVRGDGAYRKFVENTVCLLLRLIFGVRVQDANAPFRLMKADVVKKYIERLPYNYNLPNIMYTTFFVYYHEKVKFIEITFKPRQGGTNTINIKKIIKIGWNALGDFRNFKRGMKNDGMG